MFDYHLHTDNSKDSQADIAAQCEAAVEHGITEICVTDHVDLNHPFEEFSPNIPRYLSDIERARRAFPALTVKLGLELGDWEPVREETKLMATRLPLDFVLLSRHVVDGVDPYCGQPYFDKYLSRKEAYRAYAEAVLSSALAWDAFSSLAHLGYVMKRAPYEPELRPFFLADCPDAVEAILRRVIDVGASLEINTSGYRVSAYPIPTPCILKQYVRMGGESVTFGSDAHAPDAIAQFFPQALALAKSCGVKYAATFTGQKPTYHAL